MFPCLNAALAIGTRELAGFVRWSSSASCSAMQTGEQLKAPVQRWLLHSLPCGLGACLRVRISCLTRLADSAAAATSWEVLFGESVLV